jgi:serine protease AprX
LVRIQPRFRRVARKLVVLTTIASIAGAVASTVAQADGTCSLTPAPFDASAQIANDPHSMWNAIRQTGAPTYYQHGFYGQGIDVAVIDTGVAPVTGLNSGNVVQGPDLSFESNNPALAHLDTFNHGTHMAGIVAGRDPNWTTASYTNPSVFQGIAPLARVVSLKVGDSMGAVDVSQIIAAIDWAVTHRHDNGLNIRVISLSLGLHATDTWMSDALTFAATQAWKNGMVVVASAGNEGKLTADGTPTGILSPAMGNIVSVGAYDPATMAPTVFTQDPTTGNGYVTLAAPGQSINSLHVPGSYADTEILNDCLNAQANGTAWTNPIFGPNGRFVKGSGTSQSTAMVAGAAALMLSQNPKLNPDQIMYYLEKTATTLLDSTTGKPAPITRVGYGAMNLAATYGLTAPFSYNHTGTAGGGSLDAARGDSFLVDKSTGKVLSGNIDWFGAEFKPYGVNGSVQNDEPKGTAWKQVKDSAGNVIGESWNGHWLTGSGFVPDPVLGTVWTGHTWSDNDWAGHTWSGHTWSGHTWSGNRWSGDGWESDSFTGHTWSGHTWGDFSWS